MFYFPLGKTHPFECIFFLLANYHGFKRLGTFKPVAMIGGEQAIYQPWRNTYAHLVAAFGLDFLKNSEKLLI